MSKKTSLKKALRHWRQLSSEVSLAQVCRWVKNAPAT